MSTINYKKEDNNPKCVCAEQQSFKIHEKYFESRRIMDKSTMIVGAFSTPVLVDSTTEQSARIWKNGTISSTNHI